MSDCYTCKYAIWDSEEYYSGKECGMSGSSSRAFITECYKENPAIDDNGIDCDDYEERRDYED